MVGRCVVVFRVFRVVSCSAVVCRRMVRVMVMDLFVIHYFISFHGSWDLIFKDGITVYSDRGVGEMTTGVGEMTTVVKGGVQEIIAQVMLQKKRVKRKLREWIIVWMCGFARAEAGGELQYLLENSILFAQSYWMTVHVAGAE